MHYSSKIFAPVHDAGKMMTYSYASHHEQCAACSGLWRGSMRWEGGRVSRPHPCSHARARRRCQSCARDLAQWAPSDPMPKMGSSMASAAGEKEERNGKGGGYNSSFLLREDGMEGGLGGPPPWERPMRMCIKCGCASAPVGWLGHVCIMLHQSNESFHKPLIIPFLSIGIAMDQ
jgi:hypothetical protein